MTPTVFDRCKCALAAAFGALMLSSSPLAAQELEPIDPDTEYEESAAASDEADVAGPEGIGPIDGDLADGGPDAGEVPVPVPTSHTAPVPADPDSDTGNDQIAFETDVPVAAGDASDATGQDGQAAYAGSETTYGEDDLIGAAEGVFGKGAQGLAGLIEGLLRKQGEPNGYIVGREGGGAFVVGVRYGSGTLYHKVEGNMPVYWTGPSIGFDAGANAGNTFVLVYNLHDSDDIYKRFPAGEGQAYFVGGMHASYMRKGDVVLIPIRLGAGLRLGVNAGYMKFSKKQRWLPF